jgi:putative transposase
MISGILDRGESLSDGSQDLAWALVSPLLPPAGTGGRRRTTDLRAVLDAIFYLLRTGCQWRLLPRDFPAWGTVYHYFRTWKHTGVLSCVQAAIYEQTRVQAGRSACPSVVIMDGQSVKTTERGGVQCLKWPGARIRNNEGLGIAWSIPDSEYSRNGPSWPKMAFKTARRSVVRCRPPGRCGGSNGDTTAQAASLMSVL